MALMVSLPSRGLNGYAGAVLAGGVSAALFAVALMRGDTLFVMLAYFSAFPLYLAGLSAGITCGLLASVIGIASLGLTKPFDFTMFYAAVYGVPTVILTALALRQERDKDSKPVWYSEGNLLTAITLYPCVAFLAAIAAASGHDGGLFGMTKQMLMASTIQFKEILDPETYARFTAALDQMARFIPALLGCSWMMIMLLSMLAAQATLKQQGWNLRPSFRMQDIHIPPWLIFAAATTGIVGAFAPMPYKYIGINLSAMMVVPFCFAGLAIIHAVASMLKPLTTLDPLDARLPATATARKIWARVLLWGFSISFILTAAILTIVKNSDLTLSFRAYIMFAFCMTVMCVAYVWSLRKNTKAITLGVVYTILSVLPKFALGVAVIGVLDQWVDFRHRFAANSKKGG